MPSLLRDIYRIYWKWGGLIHAQMHATGADEVIVHIKIFISPEIPYFLLDWLRLGDLSFCVALWHVFLSEALKRCRISIFVSSTTA